MTNSYSIDFLGEVLSEHGFVVVLEAHVPCVIAEWT